jgi:site-specific DNA-cytosine methylase
MKILNLYSGIGGNRKLWGDAHEITAIEFNEEIAMIYKDYFPNDEVIIADAHEFLLKNYMNYDFIWSSPGNSMSVLQEQRGFDLSKFKIKQRKDTILLNCVDSELSLYILNCAMNVIQKKETPQTSLF